MKMGGACCETRNLLLDDAQKGQLIVSENAWNSSLEGKSIGRPIGTVQGEKSEKKGTKSKKRSLASNSGPPRTESSLNEK